MFRAIDLGAPRSDAPSSLVSSASARRFRLRPAFSAPGPAGTINSSQRTSHTIRSSLYRRQFESAYFLRFAIPRRRSSCSRYSALWRRNVQATWQLWFWLTCSPCDFTYRFVGMVRPSLRPVDARKPVDVMQDLEAEAVQHSELCLRGYWKRNGFFP